MTRTPALDALTAAVLGRLGALNIHARVIGAAAMASFGVSRATRDVDLLVTDKRVLDEQVWNDLIQPPFSVDVRVGDATDPLIGVVRIEAEPADDTDWDATWDQLDLILPSGAWVSPMLDRAGPAVHFHDRVAHTVTVEDLILLKLYAGSARDTWDIVSLLECRPDRPALERNVTTLVEALPDRCRRRWQRILEDTR